MIIIIETILFFTEHEIYGEIQRYNDLITRALEFLKKDSSKSIKRETVKI